MTVQIRPMEFADAAESGRLSLEAFGRPPTPTLEPTPETWSRPGMSLWGAFEGGRLLGRLASRDYHAWFGGRQVHTAGIAGVAVDPEHRGQGLLTGLFDEALTVARAHGQVISTLYPTAPGIYRRFGYELVGELLRITVPVTSLSTVEKPSGVELRRATPEDFDSVRSVYTEWARAQNGPLTRQGVSFAATATEFVDSFTGVTLAVADGRVVGYTSWQRNTGYDERATLSVDDLVALTPEAARALWAFYGSFASVIGNLDLRTSGLDPALLQLPVKTWRINHREQYMLRLLDVPGAMTARGFSPIAADLTFRAVGHHLDGSYRLRLAPDASPACEPTDPGGAVPTLTSAGLAMLYAGTQSTANLRIAGHLTGTTDQDPVFDAAFGSVQFHIRDYF